MREEIVMTKDETKEELKFAMKYGVDITKHRVVSLLNQHEVEDICRDLKLKAELRAVVSPRGEYSSYEHAYYILKFFKGNNATTDFATYFGEDLVSSDHNYVVEIDNDEGEEYGR